MRSIFVLFAMAILGFGFILQKKDPPEPVKTKTNLSELADTSRQNRMKHALDKSRSFAQNISAERKQNEL